MVEEKPWWRPIADALAAKVAKAIKDYDYEMGLEKQNLQVIDTTADDVPAKAPRTRRKALPARLDTPRVEPPLDREK